MKLKGVRNSSLKLTAKFAKAMVAKGDHYFPGLLLLGRLTLVFPLGHSKIRAKSGRSKPYVFHAWKTIDFMIHVINMCAVFFEPYGRIILIFRVSSIIRHLNLLWAWILNALCMHIPYHIVYMSSPPKAVVLCSLSRKAVVLCSNCQPF